MSAPTVNWFGLVTLILALGVGTMVHAQENPEPVVLGEGVFGTHFDTPEGRDGWTKHEAAQWVEVEGRGQCLRVSLPAGAATGGTMIQRTLDLTRYRGCRLMFECLAKADGVTKPPQSYLGVKYMVHFQAPSGQVWTNQNDVYGTFDWKPLQFSVQLPLDVTKADLNLGLQGCTGTVWFDDLKVTVYKLPVPPRPQPPANPGPVFRGHSLPRLRGVMSPNEFRDEDLRVLGMDWKANAIRWQMTRNWGATGTERDLTEYDEWFNKELDDLDKVLEAAQRYGLKVVVDMHSPPGGRLPGSELAIFHEPLYQEHWVKLWEQTARRYKGNPAVWGYDLINEPVQNRPSPDGVADWFEGQVRVAKAIRAIDPDMPIFIEANQWDSAAGFNELQPVDLPHIIYQVHMYDPGQFTHQGVNNSPTGVVYPGSIGGVEWNKDRIRRNLQPVRDFQQAYNVHIYVGEFSAIRWAPGAAQYLSDCIDVFEEYGWDWTFHAYREWEGWSPEHGPDRKDTNKTATPSERLQVLLKWFAQDEKPAY